MYPPGCNWARGSFDVSLRKGGFQHMRQRKQKNKVTERRDPAGWVMRDQAAGDVLELWIGISRLLETVTASPVPPPAKANQSLRLRRTRT